MTKCWTIQLKSEVEVCFKTMYDSLYDESNSRKIRLQNVPSLRRVSYGNRTSIFDCIDACVCVFLCGCIYAYCEQLTKKKWNALNATIYRKSSENVRSILDRIALSKRLRWPNDAHPTHELLTFDLMWYCGAIIDKQRMCRFAQFNWLHFTWYKCFNFILFAMLTVTVTATVWTKCFDCGSFRLLSL